MRLPVGNQHLGPATLTAELLAAPQRGQFGPQPVTVAHQVVDQLRRHAAAPSDAFRLLEAATIDAAAVAGLEQRIGSLSPGKQADLVLIRTGDLSLYPVNSAIGTVVHAAERSNIDTVIIKGRVRKRGGVVLGVDQARLRAAIDESCFHLFNAAGYQPDLFAASFAPIHEV
ncbi:amidohydrolase family protein [Janthinobacterium lividum]|uniref:amidohydrolase family protein n=1 Tax=Janthinobacterium lividum TaxID=29581 RepID=UPI001F0D8D77|nr:amidohydrolase family protein [Janthinobacterium lividum]